MQKITPFLWFDDKAEEAANFYVSIFKNSRIIDVRRHGGAEPGAAGSVMTVTFEIEGQQFIALNGGIGQVAGGGRGGPAGPPPAPNAPPPPPPAKPQLMVFVVDGQATK